MPGVTHPTLLAVGLHHLAERIRQSELQSERERAEGETVSASQNEAASVIELNNGTSEWICEPHGSDPWASTADREEKGHGEKETIEQSSAGFEDTEMR